MVVIHLVVFQFIVEENIIIYLANKNPELSMLDDNKICLANSWKSELIFKDDIIICLANRNPELRIKDNIII